jgi:hypothetical protein
MAVNDSLKFQNIQSFELRVAPKNSAIELHKAFKKYDKLLENNTIAETNFQADFPIIKNKIKNEKSYFYNVHFIKKKDKLSKNESVSLVTCRDNQLRNEVKEQARAIVTLRESYSSQSKYIRGIDAASSEFSTRPEAFAQAFRYLKDHKLKGKLNYLKLPEDIVEHKLYATYHAGEDFFDIVDGLRTIDEAIKFLNLRQGDRLGHALALGIKPKDYFDFKGNKIMIPKGMLLDNIAWLLAQTRKYNINTYSSEIHRLSKFFESLIYEIYRNKNNAFKTTEISHNIYYDAWKLRGDDPELYKGISDEIDIEDIPAQSQNKNSLENRPGRSNARDIGA